MSLTKAGGVKPPDETGSRKQFVIEAFDRHERKLTAYALRLYGGREGNLSAARDAVQFTFLKLCQQSPEKVAGKLAPWLYTVCRNRIFDELKSSKKRPQLSEERASQIHSDSHDPANRLEIDDFLQRLPRLLDSVSEKEREVIELWSQGLKPAEIAEVIDKPPGNVRVTLHRGIKKLKKHPEVSPWLERATGQHETRNVGRSERNGHILNTTSTGKQK